MRLTGPTLRRRNHAWLQMRSREIEAKRLARRQEEAEDADDESGEEADDGADSSDEEGGAIDSSDDESDETTTTTVPPPATTGTAGVGSGVRIIAPGNAGAIIQPGGGAPAIPGVALGAENPQDIDTDAEESADETSSPPASGTPSPTTSPFPGFVGTTPTTAITESASRSAGLEPILTPTQPAAIGPSPTIPATDTVQSDVSTIVPVDRQSSQPEGESLGTTAPVEQSNINTGAAAGIVIGVLALIGIMIGAAFFWRKWRRDRGLPFLPFRPFKGEKLDDRPYSPEISGPLPGGLGIHNPAKTNTKIMDDLMKAAYAVDGGTNNMQAAFNSTPKPPPQPPQAAFMDEKAYVALAGPLTPRTPKPVSRWLDEVKTPTQSEAPGIPPSPQMPRSASPPRPGPPMAGPGRIPEAPRPAYHGRETMTTETTNTSVRWYG